MSGQRVDADGTDATSLHATCLVVGETGILITGASGSGKTALALALIDRSADAGRFARLVADDRVLVERRHGRLVARPHPLVAGRVEIRGLGIRPSNHEPACVVGLVVRRDETAARLPEAADLRTDLVGCSLPSLAVGSVGDPAMFVVAWLEGLESAFHDTPVTIT